MRLGTNLPALKEWLIPDYQPFVDAMKSAPKPMAIKPDGGMDWGRTIPVGVDGNGYPLGGQQVGTRLTLPDSNYSMIGQSPDGTGTSDFFSGDKATWDKATWDKRFTDIKCLPNNFIGSEAAFRPQFTQAISHAKVIRFMDWQNTNNSVAVKWEDRNTPEHITQNCGTLHGNPQGVALEHMLDLAKATGTVPWLCIPDQATDDYITAFASMCRDSAIPRFYIEHSNEMWNAMFKQYQRSKEKGRAQFGVTNNFEAVMLWHGWRTIRISQIFQQVFGDEFSYRVRITFGCGRMQTSSWRKPMDWNYPGGLKLQDHIHSMAVAFYFGDHVGNSSSGPFRARVLDPGQYTVDSVLAECEWSLEKTIDRMRFMKDEADFYGLELHGYEAGHHLDVVKLSSDPARHKELKSPIETLFRIAANHELMGHMYVKMLRAWDEIVGSDSTMCLFTGPGIGTKGNDFSIHPGDKRYEAIEVYTGTTPPLPPDPKPTPDPDPTPIPEPDPGPHPDPPEEPQPDPITDRLQYIVDNMVTTDRLKSELAGLSGQMDAGFKAIDDGIAASTLDIKWLRTYFEQIRQL